ncbi:hypothetical protein AB5J62_25105 [Amycolatopsis sp. cg5]|uniref:hypothetical protein n=1 Tax=Amycolatopsis sp. cg5 TaxID=3238802 RepID=UPI0035239E4A
MSDYLNRARGGSSVTNTTINMSDNRGNMTVVSENVQQTMNAGLDVTEVLKFAGLVRQQCGLESGAAFLPADQAGRRGTGGPFEPSGETSTGDFVRDVIVQAKRWLDSCAGEACDDALTALSGTPPGPVMLGFRPEDAF